MSIEIDGLTAVVHEFDFHAKRLQPDVERTVVEHAGQAAQKMRDRVSIGATQMTLESITADEEASRDLHGAYADAGPEWFVARFLEHGTVKMGPRPFAGPSADEQFPQFERDMDRLGPR